MTLKELRIAKNLTQCDASEICHIPLRSYKRLENDPSYSKSIKYLNAIKCLEEYVEKRKNVPSYNILVIGAGYVGLSVAVLLSIDNHVDVIDINEDKVNKLNNRIPIFKDREIERYLKNRQLDLTAYLPNINLYKDKDYIIISIPTDFNDETKLLNTNNIVNLVKEIRTVNKKAIIVIKSTCFIGFTDSLDDPNTIFCPEFLREGRALLDNLYPSRIIVGGDKNNNKVKQFGELLRNHSLNRAKVLYMSAKEAEAVKLFSNAYLAMRVAYFNELDSFAIANDIDTKNIIEGVSLDNRIGDYYNNPSFGYGGYCLPKDTLSLIHQMNGVDNNNLIGSINNSNKSRKDLVTKDILNRLKELNGHSVGIYSLESKQNSGNIRNSAILDVISNLEKKEITIVYYSNEKDLSSFKKKSDLILTNRYDSSLDDVKDKVYTRDVYTRD